MVVVSVTPSLPSPSLHSHTNTDDRPSSNHRNLLHHMNHCTSVSHLKEIHALTLRTAPTNQYHALFLYSRLLQSSTLFDLDYAFRVFDQIEEPNSFMWNTLIRACAHSSDRKEQAILTFNEMLKNGSVLPDKHTFPFVLKACAYIFALSEGLQAHAQLLKLGLESDVYVNNSLIHFYATCGCLKDARDVFEKMPERSAVSWNVMINALVELGEFENALKLFTEMQKSFEPDRYALHSAVNACAGLGALSTGMWIHAYVLTNCDGDVAGDTLMSSALVDMYCKCGSIEMANQVFDRMHKRDVNAWNSMILGLAMHGQAESALDYFTRMVDGGIVPHSVTFVGVLSACNYRGMVAEGREYFHKMIHDYRIEPVLEHYGCLVDLLARAGLIDEALDIVSTMPVKPDAIIWRSLLDACSKKNGGVLELSEGVARQMIESDAGACSGEYVLLSKVYASAGKWDEVGLVRKLMTDKGLAKEPGCTSIEVDGVAHEFFAGDTTHPRTKEIYRLLDEIEESLESRGYVPDYSQAPLVDELDHGRRDSLRLHSERLAIAFGLLNAKPGVPIRIFKNLRVCKDCHSVTKLISSIYDVEIVVRDRLRFHHFKHGSCSCKDYW